MGESRHRTGGAVLSNKVRRAVRLERARVPGEDGNPPDFHRQQADVRGAALVHCILSREVPFGRFHRRRAAALTDSPVRKHDLVPNFVPEHAARLCRTHDDFSTEAIRGTQKGICGQDAETEVL